MNGATTDPLRLLHARDTANADNVDDHRRLAQTDLEQGKISGAHTSELHSFGVQQHSRLARCCARNSLCSRATRMCGLFLVLLLGALMIVLAVMANNGVDANFQYTFDVERKVEANSRELEELRAAIAALTGAAV